VKDGRAKKEINDLLSCITDLQAKLSAARTQYEQLAEVRNQLECQLREHERWDEEASRYELVTLPSGCTVYSRRLNAEPPEPAHYACPHCMHGHRKSILQPTSFDRNEYVCHQCRFQARIKMPAPLAISVAEL
jgi:hypothetical protein